MLVHQVRIILVLGICLEVVRFRWNGTS